MTEDGRQNDDEATHTNGPNTPDDERGGQYDQRHPTDYA